MFSTIIYYIVTWKRRKEFRARSDKIGTITIWNKHDAMKLANEWTRFEMGMLGLWGIAFFCEVYITFSVIYGFNPIK